jgi:2-iminobutanoate/2-iminopropanoate deaminase
MTERRALASSDAPPALGAYSPGVAVDRLVFISGQIGWNSDGSGLSERGPAEQATQALRNIEALLQSAGGSLRDVVKVTVYLDDLASTVAVNAAYAQVMADAGVSPLPARTIVAAGVPAAVEIDAIAILAS